MAKDDERTLVRCDPTSWNGISYDDMMRSLEDALPPDDRSTLVGSLPTRPASFEPVPVTQRLPPPPPHVDVVRHTQPMSTVAPVAMPAAPVGPLRYVDYDADVDLDAEPFAKRAARSRTRSAVRGALIGAMVAAVAAGVFAWMDPATHAQTTAMASGARTHVSSWASRIASKPAPATTPAVAAPPPQAAPVAEPIAIAPPVLIDAPKVPEMREPTPPPAQPARTKAKAKPKADAEDATPAESVDDPSSLLDRGLGQ